MYFEYETKYNLYQKLYRLERSKIEVWEIYEVKSIMTSNSDSAENHSTSYRLKCTSEEGHSTKLLLQNEVAKEFFTSKADIIKKIADQL